MIASVALLLANRTVWGVAVMLALACGGQTTLTYLRTRNHVAEAEGRIEAAAKNVIQLEKDDEQE